MTARPAPEIDAPLLEKRIHELGDLGRDAEGMLFRPVYTESWLQARDRLEAWMREAGLSTSVDAAGNLFGRLEGADPSRPAVLTGSHIDTVRNGGKYDGALGVHAGISALAAIAATGQAPPAPLEVVALCEEEGSRYTSTYWGTQAILGLTEPADPERLRDAEGVSIAEAMASVGLDHRRLAEACRSDIAAFVELHIEQGGIMEAEGIEVGVVEVITGQSHLTVTVTGHQNHAGTTPMDLRRDALTAAAEMVVTVEALAVGRGRPTVATVGQLELSPGSRNVIPGEVLFTVDVRNPGLEDFPAVVAELTRRIEEVAATRGVQTQIHEDRHSAKQPVRMDPRVVRAVSAAAQELGLVHSPMVSGAGHDSQLFAQHLPAGMVFTPSTGGISHSPEEFTPIEEIVPCVEVLAATLLRLADEVAGTRAGEAESP